MVSNVMLLGLDSQEERAEKIMTCIHYTSVSSVCYAQQTNLEEY